MGFRSAKKGINRFLRANGCNKDIESFIRKEWECVKFYGIQALAVEEKTFKDFKYDTRRWSSYCEVDHPIINYLFMSYLTLFFSNWFNLVVIIFYVTEQRLRQN